MIRYQYDNLSGRENRRPDQGLGYTPGMAVLHHLRTDLDAVTMDPRLKVKLWKLDPDALRPEDYREIDKVIRNFIETENRILAVFEDLDRRASDLRRNEPEAVKAFLDSNQAWYQPAVDKLQERFRGTYWEEEFQYRYAAFIHPEVPFPRDGGTPKKQIPGTILQGTLQYTARDIPLAELRRVVNGALLLRRQLLILAMVTENGLRRAAWANQEAFYYAKVQAAEEAARKAEDDYGWGLAGDILGILSAVAGVLALIPILTPFAGPAALLFGAASLGAHATSVSIKGDWDKPGALVGIGVDMLALIPGIGAVAKGAKAAGTTMVSVGKLGIAARSGGRAFVHAVAGPAASEASTVFGYLGKQVATRGPKALASQGTTIGKVLQGGTNLATQVPLMIELTTGTDQSDGKDIATNAAFIANYGQTIGNWGVVGTGFQKAGTVSLGLFAKIIGRR